MMTNRKPLTRQDMKRLVLPHIEGLEQMSFGRLCDIMEREAIRQGIDCVNWREYPYCPIVSFDAAYSDRYLFVRFFVRGLGVKAAYCNDNDPVWQDSCVELFVATPDGDGYFNFEMNCIGALLAARRKSRKEGVEHLDAAGLSRVVRHSTFERRAFAERGGICEWSVAMGIPFDLLGYPEGVRPSVLRANLYKCADETAVPHYVSWNPIDTPAPDFHRPEFFGELILG